MAGHGGHGFWSNVIAPRLYKKCVELIIFAIYCKTVKFDAECAGKTKINDFNVVRFGQMSFTNDDVFMNIMLDFSELFRLGYSLNLLHDCWSMANKNPTILDIGICALHCLKVLTSPPTEPAAVHSIAGDPLAELLSELLYPAPLPSSNMGHGNGKGGNSGNGNRGGNGGSWNRSSNSNNSESSESEDDRTTSQPTSTPTSQPSH